MSISNSTTKASKLAKNPFSMTYSNRQTLLLQYQSEVQMEDILCKSRITTKVKTFTSSSRTIIDLDQRSHQKKKSQKDSYSLFTVK